MTKNLSRKVLTTGVFLAAIGLTGIVAYQGTIKQYLTPKDFKEVNWIPRENKDGIIWGEYMSENIPHISHNWATYQKAVNEMNAQGLTGYIFLPDLDKDGKVGEENKK